MKNYIFIGLMIGLAIYVFKRLMTEVKPSQSDAPESKDEVENSKVENSEVENMVQCATCRVHLPRSEAFLVNDIFYCSHAHIPNQ